MIDLILTGFLYLTLTLIALCGVYAEVLARRPIQ